MIMLLSSCVSETFKDDPEFTAMKGVMTAQKSNDEYDGTHLITDETGKITPIRSLSINLDSSKYLNNEIEALGVLNPEDAVFEVTGISVIEVLVTESEKAESVLYKNTEFGFELYYSSSWKVGEIDNKVIFSHIQDEENQRREEIVVEQIPYSYYPKISEDGSSDSPLIAYFLETTEEDVSQKINKVGVDSLDAVKEENADNSIVYTFYRSGLIYRVSYTPDDGVDNLAVKNIFLEMINSFRFIGFEVDGPEEVVDEDQPEESSVELSDLELTSFESLPYFFSGKYPKSWYYAGIRGDANGVKHHYGFSDESVTEANELISLEVLSGANFSGQKQVLNGRELFVQSGSGVYTIFFTLDGQHYKVSGKSEYEDLILTIALTIEAIEKPSGDEV